ncbi:phytanoyl-CoA dioxygenase family protein [Pseudonocardia nematodicida]|uniref:Phytanoyl-CoA dioxygenase family protein n=1 Tax=Pseudonocardia nematodicida TaxID=1206997 RepID=A0ABV1K666_9PSEU
MNSDVRESPVLGEAQRRLLPDDDDIAFYDEHGWWVSPRILDDDVLDAAVRGAERFYAGDRDRRLPVETGYVDWHPGDGDEVRNSQHASYRNAELRALALQPVVGAIAARLARTDEIRIFEDTLVYKAPTPAGATGGVVGWHTDYSYSSNCVSQRMLSAWIPTHDVPADRAPLIVVDGSHRWPATEHLRCFNDQDLDGVRTRFATQGREIVEIPLVMGRGQVSFHHSHLVHGSRPNRAELPRMALAVYLQDGDNRYREFWNDGVRIHHFLDGVCRRDADGAPDYADPEFFPVLWRSPDPTVS